MTRLELATLTLARSAKFSATPPSRLSPLSPVSASAVSAESAPLRRLSLNALNLCEALERPTPEGLPYRHVSGAQSPHRSPARRLLLGDRRRVLCSARARVLRS